MVENQFQQKIATFQCDGGGEFINNQFASHLASCGIKQLVSCPYTPQQNGLAGKHRHITELGLSMMFEGKVPHYLWVEAFYTANYLCNLLPSSVLPNQKSPYEALMGKSPVYTSLHVFGCACYPNLRPYAHNKFDPKSLICVFTGYSEQYKGYMCFHPPTGKVYINRHVLFDESKFPFSDIYKGKLSSVESPLLSAWQESFLPKTMSTSQDTTVHNTVEQDESSDVVGKRGYGCTTDIDSVPISNSLSSPSHIQNTSSQTTPNSLAVSENSSASSREDSVFSEEDFPPLPTLNTNVQPEASSC